jgi:penicillin-binding protein 1A
MADGLQENTTADTKSAIGRTGAALAELARAMRADAAALWRRMRVKRCQDIPTTARSGVAHSSRLLLLAALGVVVVAFSFAALMLWTLRELPIENAVTTRERVIALETSDGKPLGRIGPLKTSDAARAEFPAILVDAVLSTEDRRFYSHWGIDVVGMLRATRHNLIAGAMVQGGSTITQQLVKMRVVGNERTFARKISEALAAIWLETRFSKDEILTSYLNSVYLGAGAQGMPAAAELYFNKQLADLTLPEAALLAGLIKAPSRYNPLHNLASARARTIHVLNAMIENGRISRAAADAAIANPASLHHPALASSSGTWFSDWVAQEARDVTGQFVGNIRVRTTLDPRQQAIAERVLQEALRENVDNHVSQAALVAMRPDGAVLAMVGGRDFNESQFNRAVQARRQPGSAFKLFVYMAALRSGMDVNDTVDASPLKVGDWEPENDSGRVFGHVTLGEAFARSINTAAVRLAVDVGIDKVIAAARDFGIEGPLPEVPSLALGTAEVSLLEMTAAYAGVMSGKAPVKPWGVAAFASEEQPRLVSVAPPAVSGAALGVREPLYALLRLAVERGTGRAATVEGFAAGKTGTTQDHRDAWFIGFTDKLVVGVWVGNDDRTPMDGVTGGALPARIWRAFIEAVNTQEPGVTAREEEGASNCDFRACAATYQSFNAADCTYQPYGGGARQRCIKGTSVEMSAREPSHPARCDAAACAAAYQSFQASDCSYQPVDGGPRRACLKGGARPGTPRDGVDEPDETPAGYRSLRDAFFAN